MAEKAIQEVSKDGKVKAKEIRLKDKLESKKFCQLFCVVLILLMVLTLQTDRSSQTMKIQFRLLLESLNKHNLGQLNLIQLVKVDKK